MTQEIAALGIEVKTDGVKAGSEALDKLAKAGANAEQSTKSMSDAASKASAQIAAMAQKAQNAGTSFKPLDGSANSISKVAVEAQRANTSLSGLAGKASHFEKITKSSEDAANNIGKATQKLKELDSEAKRAGDSTSAIGSKISDIGRLASSLFAGVTIAGFAGKLVSVQREFDILNSSLITITGSSKAAEKELEWIKVFAAETPFSLNEVTKAFVKMRSLGLDASKESLTSYGNTASAMGKSLDQMIEAVADASTGEFERLKEFGIKAKKNGDDVSLTFQGVTKTIKSNADEITNYLTEIGNKNFFGAMAERAKTLDGAISNLGDTWDELFRTINQNNAGSVIYDSVKLATAAITDAISIIRQMNDVTRDGAREIGFFTSAQNGLATVFETVAVLGMNVKYVLVQIGNEIGGIAAQAAAVAKLNFREAQAIGQMMREDAAKARADLDASEKRVMNRNKFNNDLGALSDGLPSEPRKKSPSVPNGTKKAKSVSEQASEEAKAYERAMQAFADITREAEKSTLGLTASQGKLYDLMKLPQWANMPEPWRLTAIAEYESARAAELNAEALKDVEAQQQKNIDSRKSMIEQIQKVREEAEFYGLTASQISVVEQARLADAIAIAQQNGLSKDQIDYLKDELELRSRLTDALIQVDTKKNETSEPKKDFNEMDKFAESAAKNIQSSLADFLFDPFAHGIKGMADSFGKMLQRMIADAAAAQIARALFGDMLSASGGKSSGDNGWIGAAIKIAGAYFGGSSGASETSSFSDASAMWNAKGNAFTGSGHVQAFATGGAFGNGEVLNQPTAFRFASGGAFKTGIAGEAGPEGALPLKRMGNGKLGVYMEGASSAPMTIQQNFYGDTGSDRAQVRRSAAAGARSALGAMNGARRYG